MRNACFFVLGVAALAAFNGCGPMPVPLPPDLVVDDPYSGEATYPIFVDVWDDGGGHVTASVTGETEDGRDINRFLNDLVWESDGEFAGWSAGRYPAGDYTVVVCSENESGKDCETRAITLGGGSGNNGGSGGNGGQGGNGGSGGTGGDGGAGTGGNGGWVINNSGSVTIIINSTVDYGDGDANGGDGSGSGGDDGENPPDEDCEPWTALPAGVVVVKTGVRTVPSGIPAHPTQTFAGLSVLKDGHVLGETDLPSCQELAGIEVIVQGTGFLNDEYSRSTYEAVVTLDEVDLWIEDTFWVYLYILNTETGVETPFLVPIQ